MVIDNIEVTNVTCQSGIVSVSVKNYNLQMKKAHVVSFVNPDPSLKGNALFGWIETPSFGELKRERAGGATTSIAVITPSSIHDSDYLQNHRRRAAEMKKKGKMKGSAYHGAA
jgi:hypothetical protein